MRASAANMRQPRLSGPRQAWALHSDTNPCIHTQRAGAPSSRECAADRGHRTKERGPGTHGALTKKQDAARLVVFMFVLGGRVDLLASWGRESWSLCM